MIICAPRKLVPIIVESLIEAGRAAAEDVERSGMDLDSFLDAVAAFDSIKNALESIGVGHCDLDLDAHRAALQVALTARVNLERGMLAEGDRTAVARLRALLAYMREAGIAP
jgi:hypothetical protein